VDPSAQRPATADPAPLAELIAELAPQLGNRGLLTAPVDVEPYLVDHRRLYRGRTLLVAAPATTAEVQAVVQACAARGIPIVPHGGNTSYCGGATPTESGVEVVLATTRLRQVRAVDPANNSITVEAGCRLADVQDAAAANGRLFPLSLGSEGSCTIGGNLSTNAGGTAVLRYGMMRELVLGLEVVLPDGRVLDQLRGLRKDNTGYDVKQLFIGAEGTLGVITAACLKLFPAPAGHATAWVGLASAADAVTLLGVLQSALGDALTTYELVPTIALDLVLEHVPDTTAPLSSNHPMHALVEVTLSALDSDLPARLEQALGAAHERGLVGDAVVASSLAQREALWKLRETIPEAQTREGASLKHDVAVPTSDVPAFIDAGRAIVERSIPGARLVAYGHLGDGNLHFNVSPPKLGAGPGNARDFLAHGPALKRELHDLVAQFRGSFSAEHGIGRLKVGELERYEDPVALDVMRRIKRALDPQGLMNPGKVLDDGR